ncbi:MAG: hypothetical protein LBF90_03135 [Prevotellaceae bacterium]|jgi:hypothetical protein|nr:hypothetical protein [Prevotellaceae bacterium]
MKKRFLSTLAWVAFAALSMFGQSVVRIEQLSHARPYEIQRLRQRLRLSAQRHATV